MTAAALSGKRFVEPKAAVTRFLADMAKVAKRTYPAWHETLTDGIKDCPLSYDQRRAVLEIHPLDDYYFAGVVALEVSKIRQYFPHDEASELLSLIAEQIDALANRTDRVVSDLAFFIASRIELARGIDKQKMPYDQVVKAILQRLGIDKIEATQHLMTETVYRHMLGEPLGVPEWWKNFRAKYKINTDDVEKPAATIVQAITVTKPAPATPEPRKPRRAVVFQ
jgi:hypothetical protein